MRFGLDLFDCLGRVGGFPYNDYMEYTWLMKTFVSWLVLLLLAVSVGSVASGSDCFIDSSRSPVTSYCPASYNNFLPKERTANEINYLVIHTVQGSLESAVGTFSSSDLGYPRSAHYIVGKNGEVVKSVPARKVAWHAGTDPPGSGGDHESRVLNSNSIGIEHGGYVDDPDFPTREQYVTSAALTRYLCEIYDIPIDREHIVGHEEIKGTKGDPGPQWNWSYYLDLVRNGTRGGDDLPGILQSEADVSTTSGAGSLPAMALLAAGVALLSWGMVGN